jgi:hypothetical protein
MFVLEPFGLRLARWDAAKKLQEQKRQQNSKLQTQGRPEFPNGLALRLFHRVVSFLFRFPSAGLIFSLNHRPYSAYDAFLVCIIFWHSLCKWNQTLAHIFSHAVAPLQQ